MTSDSPRLRLGIVGIVVLSLFAALFARLWYLQVMDSERYEEVSQANRVRVVAEEAPRGRILDSQGRIIVDNRTSLVVTVDPNELGELDDPERDEVIRALAGELTSFGVPTKVDRVERRLVDPQYDPLQPIPVAIDVPEELEVFLAERAEQFPGIAVRRESVRTYPHGVAAAHILGYVGRVSQEEFEAEMGEDASGVAALASDHPKPYQPDSNVGKTGVEQAFEDELRGVPGVRRIEVDANGRPVRTIDDQAAEPGNDIQLTVDIELQQRAEAELASQLQTLRGGARAPAGSVVLLDPRNGDVLAMASYPTFDPADFVNGISQERYDRLTGGDDAENPLINRAVAGQYAPGSTFKPITAHAALSKGMVDPNQWRNDPGTYHIVGCPDDGPGCVLRNAGGQAHGSVNMARSLTVSSNVYYFELGDRFYRERAIHGDAIQESARQFGLGSPTGIDLPEETGGVVPDPEWKQELYDAMPEDQQALGDPTWYPGDSANIAAGQGDMLATPLQMARAYGVVANGGIVHEPRLVKRILAPGDDVDDPEAGRAMQPDVVEEFEFQPQWRDPILEGLVGVAQGDGTASAAFDGWDHQAWPVASKTGTAEVEARDDDFAVFGAFGPADAPEYVAFTVLEEAGFGGEAAAPMVRRIFEVLAGQEPLQPDEELPPEAQGEGPVVGTAEGIPEPVGPPVNGGAPVP